MENNTTENQKKQNRSQVLQIVLFSDIDHKNNQFIIYIDIKVELNIFNKQLRIINSGYEDIENNQK